MLFAYTWIMYLALFNGGRWIRSQILSTTTTTTSHPSQFWPHNALAGAHLTFWHFPGPADGEDLKDTFKANFELAASQLTDQERQDVIAEAVEIFKLCARIVEELDRECGSSTPSRRSALTLMGSSPRLSAVTSQLYGILLWMWALVLTPLVRAQRAGPEAGHGMVGEKEIQVR
jgi:hypothetical protein